MGGKDMAAQELLSSYTSQKKQSNRFDNRFIATRHHYGLILSPTQLDTFWYDLWPLNEVVLIYIPIIILGY